MRPGILLYWDFVPVFKILSAEDCKTILLALVQYARTGEAPKLTGKLAEVWPDFRAAADRDAEAYENKTQGNRFGGCVTSFKEAGAEPLSREDWEAAGKPSNYAEYSSSRAQASSSLATASQHNTTQPNTSHHITSPAHRMKAAELKTDEQLFEDMRRAAERKLTEHGS